MTKTNLSVIKIKIPKNKQLIQELETVFHQIKTLQNEVKVAEDLYKQLIQELSKEAIPQEKKNVKEEPIEFTTIKVEEEKDEKEEKNTTKTKKPKKEKEEKKAEPIIKKKLKFHYITSPSDEELIDHAQPI